MGKGLKFLVAGAVLGLMAVFALIGVKSVLDNKTTEGNAISSAEWVKPTLEGAVTPHVDGSQTLADQAENQPADNTQLTPAPTVDSTQNTTTTTTQPETQTAGNTTAAKEQAQTEEQQPTESTESTQEEAKLDMQLIDEFGGLQLTVSDPASPNEPARAQFVIRDAQDQVVANMKDTDTASFDLSPGIYEITVIAKEKKSARMVRIVTGEFVTEHFDLPTDARQNAQQQAQQAQQANTQSQQQANNQASNQTNAQTNNNNQATGQQAQTQEVVPPPPVTNGNGKLAVIVQAAGSNAPLKSNIYVQLPNGKHVTKKNYADFANFELRPGTYKVTVKAQGKVDVVRNIQIQQNGSAQEVFSMQSPAAQAQVKPKPPTEGTLVMELRSPTNAQGKKSRGRFVIQDAKGKRVTRMRGVSHAEVKLKPGRYNVIAIHRGSRLSKPVNIVQGRTNPIIFNINEFPRRTQAQQNQVQQIQQQAQVQVPAKRGVLQLIAVSGVNQQPLKVNFLVSTLDGKRLKSANNVSVTELSLPPQDVLVDIAYEEMRGQERIKVKAGEPTVFTFTVSPNNQAQAPINQIQQQAPQSLEGMLLERLQQEILQRMNN